MKPNKEILLLPRQGYWHWVDAVRAYADLTKSVVAPYPENVVALYETGDTVSVVCPTDGYPQHGDILAWLRRNLPPTAAILAIHAIAPFELQAHLESSQALPSSPVDVAPTRSATSPSAASRVEVESGLDNSLLQLTWPTDSTSVTQPFGANPLLFRGEGLPGHNGIDIKAFTNSPVYAAASGIVDLVHDGLGDPKGIHIVISHREGFQTLYCHLNHSIVHTGMHVEAGSLIGYSGDTGDSGGGHLHFGLKKRGATAQGLTTYSADIVDPTPYLSLPPKNSSGESHSTWPFEYGMFGVIGHVDGRMTTQDFECARIARVEGLQLDLSATAEDVSRCNELLQSPFLIVNLSTRLSRQGVAPSDFVRRVQSRAIELYDAGVRYFEIQSEPNVVRGGLSIAWRDGHEFGEWFLQVVGEMRTILPDAKLGWPGLVPGPSVVGQCQGQDEFLDLAGDAVGWADWIGCHCFWNSFGEIDASDGGRNYERYLAHWPTTPILITQFSNISTTPAVVKASEYVQYMHTLRTEGKICAAFAFAISAQSGFANETWISSQDDGSAVARVLGAR
jgi:hypothetical protein